MKKEVLLIIVFTSITIIAYAGSITNLVIKQKTGNEIVLSLESNPVITFDGLYMNVRNNLTSFTFPIDDIDQYNVSSTSDVKEAACMPHYTNGQVSFNNLPQGSKVFVVTLDGKVIRNIAADGMGMVTFNLGDLPKGTCIINTAKKSFKVVNK